MNLTAITNKIIKFSVIYIPAFLLCIILFILLSIGIRSPEKTTFGVLLSFFNILFFPFAVMVKYIWIIILLFLILSTTTIITLIDGINRKKEKKINLVLSLTSIIIIAISFALINKQTVTATEIFRKLPQNYILENITVKNFLQRWQFFLQGVTENKNFNFDLISWSPDDHYLIYSQSNYDCKDQQRLVYEAKCNEYWYAYDIIQHASQLINQWPSKKNISIYGFSSDGTILYFNDGFLTYNLKTKEWKQQTSPADKIDIIAVKTELTEPTQTNNGWCFEDDQKQLLCLTEALFSPQLLISNNKKAIAIIYHKGFGPQAILIVRQNP